MRIQYFLFSLFFTLASSFSLAQQRCATMEADSMLRANNPNMETLMDFESWLQMKMAQGGNGQMSVLSGNNRVIPTVVHVIYSNATENISTAQIQSQIDVLNEDFQRLNPDSINTPAVFQQFAANCQIEFCLATVDPNGNPTDGIDRISMSGSPFSMSTFENTIKPSTSWNPNNYFNLWVANLSGGLLGYAQFPNSSGLSGLNANNGNANTDGVVVLYSSVGRPPANPFGGAYNRGRTATHEVGHWLGLRHIWGDGNCTVDDFCNDTPKSDAANFGCPTTNSCTDSPTNYNDMVQNYMDYTDDACMNIFTNDQKSRMDVVLTNSPRRASLLVSAACGNPTGVLADFTANSTSGCAPMTVQFTDLSLGSITSWSWNFGDGNTSTSQNPSHTYNTPGLYTVTLTVSDGTNNDTEVKTDYINVMGGGIGLPYMYDFQSATWPPTGWTINNPDAATTWQRTTAAGYQSSASAWMDNYNYAANGQVDEMILPMFDFSTYASAQIEWDLSYALYSQTGFSDTLRIKVSTDCGATWTTVWEKYDQALTTVTPYYQTGAFVPNNNNKWRHETQSLNAFAFQPGVLISIHHTTDYENNLYVDNINITGVQGAPAPVADFSANNTSICAGETVTFTDLSTNSPTSWSWNFGDGNTSTQQNPSNTYTTPGTYTVTLNSTNTGGTDSEIKTNYIVVNANPAVSMTNVNHTSCGQNNGSATANPTGGSPSYNYLWSTGATTGTISNLPSGTYTVTVTDQNGCTGTQSVTINGSTAPTATITATVNAGCGLSNGSATASATGGAGGYTYLWSNGQTTATAINLAAGSYTVTVTDGAGCTSTAIANITNPGGPTLTVSNVVHTSCGQNNGSASASATGGAGGYTYNWSTGATTTSVSNLPAGTYSVTVTDNNSCSDVQTVVINASSSPTVGISSQVNDACGQSNGEATASATGGSGGYTYAWSNGQTTQTATGLAAGTYTVTVTDGSGCTGSTTVTINAISGPAVTSSGNDVSCAGAGDGSAMATPTGGTPGYSYSWSNGQTSQNATGLSGGTYYVTITDALGCTTVDSVTISEPTALTVSTSSTSESAPGANDGTATATPSGGTPGYTYSWSDGQTTQTATGLAGGTYTVTITDANGCTMVETVVVSTLTGVAVSEIPGLMVYPNPNNGQFILQYELPGIADLEYRVFNKLGQVILERKKESVVSGKDDILLTNVSSGIYYLEITSGEYRSVKKIIVEK